MDPSITARFKGRCGLCQKVIWPGEMIVNVEGEWSHDWCAENHGYLQDPDEDLAEDEAA
jgi:hypothetical protein